MALFQDCDNHADWPKLLDFVASCYNSASNKSTKMTPNILFQERELPSSVTLLPANPKAEHENYGALAADMVTRMTIAQDLAREFLSDSARHGKNYIEKKVRPLVLFPGD
jgi:hypothetical protein